jgi:hypothetical protein
VRVEAFAEISESSDFGPGKSNKVESFSEVLVCVVMVLQPVSKPLDRF